VVLEDEHDLLAGFEIDPVGRELEALLGRYRDPV